MLRFVADENFKGSIARGLRRLTPPPSAHTIVSGRHGQPGSRRASCRNLPRRVCWTA
jgi:hypothetical protein